MPIPYEIYDSSTDDSSSAPNADGPSMDNPLRTLRVRLVGGAIPNFGSLSNADETCIEHPDPRSDAQSGRRTRRRLSISGRDSRATFGIDDDEDDREVEHNSRNSDDETAGRTDPSNRFSFDFASAFLPFSTGRPHQHHHPRFNSREGETNWRRQINSSSIHSTLRRDNVSDRLLNDPASSASRFANQIMQLNAISSLSEQDRDGHRWRSAVSTQEDLHRARIMERLRQHRRNFGAYTSQPTVGPTNPGSENNNNEEEDEAEPEAEVEEPDDNTEVNGFTMPTPPEAPMTRRSFSPVRRSMPPLSRASSTTNASATNVPTPQSSASSTAASSLSCTRIEEAIKLLQSDFSDVLDREDMLTMMDILESETKTVIFLASRSDMRLPWMRRQIWCNRTGFSVPPPHMPAERPPPQTFQQHPSVGSERHARVEPEVEVEEPAQARNAAEDLEEDDEDAGPDLSWMALMERNMRGQAVNQAAVGDV